MDLPRYVTDEAAFERELAVDQAAYEAMKEQLHRDYAGQYVAIAHGRLVAVTATLEEAEAAIDQLEPPPQHFLIFPADEEPAFGEVFDY
jgi:hypothetical protein